jgi:hypothetical protein
MKPSTSPAQIAANRANAAASTGPRTPEGKDTSRYNRLRHGLSSPLTVLPFENQDEYNNLYASFCEEYSPAGPTEESFVKQIADAQWKLKRIEKVENHLFEAMLRIESEALQTEPNADPFAAIAAALLGPAKHQQALNSLVRYQSSLNRQFHTAVKSLRALQTERRKLAEEDLKREAIHQITGIADRSQSERNVIDLLAADPDLVTRDIDAEAAALGAVAGREVKKAA